jgi:hypothetical protein
MPDWTPSPWAVLACVLSVALIGSVGAHSITNADQKCVRYAHDDA